MRRTHPSLIVIRSARSGSHSPRSAAEASVPVAEWQRQGLRGSGFGRRRGQPQMSPGQRGCGPSAWGADHEALAHQERLSDGLDGLWLLPDRDGKGAQTHRTTTEPATQGLQYRTIQPVQATVVDVEQG